MLSLKNRLVLTYMLFIFLSVSVLTVFINLFAGSIFSEFTRNNIENQSREIADSIAGQYDPFTKKFDLVTTEYMCMYFVHKGYIISISDPEGNEIWNARSIDNQRCAEVIQEITERMENEYRVKGSLASRVYPLSYGGEGIGRISIETYGPFFYNEAESGFLNTFNRFMFIAGITFTLLSIIISLFLAAAISRPILKAAETARHIAGGKFTIRMPGNYKTRELHELARSINELAGGLENGEKWQKRLSADIAHELRTPLTCLQGNIEAMIDGIWEPTGERLEVCREEITRLSNLVNDLNELSILERDNFILSKTGFRLEKLLKAAADQFMTIAAGKGIALNLGPAGFELYADYNRLMQVFINLLSNAVKYTDTGSVDVSASLLPVGGAEGGGCLITVADTGIGIAENELPHIFERFYRSDKSRNRNSGGAGIGLTIAASIVGAHGGRITVESKTGAGSVFRVFLPV
jgi:signal transduction histidine kinase